MAEDVKEVDGENTTVEPVETLTKEQAEELIKSSVTEVSKKWQSRFDALLTEKKDLEKKTEESEKTWQERLQSEVSGVKTELESWKSEALNERLRAQAIKHVSSAGIELDDVEEMLVYKLIDPKSDDPLSAVDAYIEREKSKAEKIKLSVADEFAKQNGRRVTKTDSSVKTIDDYSDDEVKSMTATEFEKVMARSKR